MKICDIVIIGAATSGAFFAQRMASKGYQVHVIEKQSYEDFGRKMDIFHVAKKDFDLYGLPEAKPGDDAWAFTFSDNYSCSPYDHYPKWTGDTVIGLHMHEYIVKMNEWAKEAGATFEYEAFFMDFLWEDDKVAGIRYQTPEGVREISAQVVVDCSGIPSVARCKLPENYGIENFPLTPEDMFYVTLWYVKWKNKETKTSDVCRGWPFYKAWIAPQADPEGAILGVGAVDSYEHGEEVFRSLEATFPLPEYEVTRIERGATPYCRTPYSLVADHFLIAGDTACLTKPNCGEGVTSSMVHMEIAAEVLDEALRQGEATRDRLWPINIRYNEKQGADFAYTRALFIKAVTATKDEFEFFFKHNIVFKDQNPADVDKHTVTEEGFGETLKMFGNLLGGVITGKFSIKTLKNLLSGLSLGGKLKDHYLHFPQSPQGYEEWTKVADEMWEKIGKMR